MNKANLFFLFTNPVFLGFFSVVSYLGSEFMSTFSNFNLNLEKIVLGLGAINSNISEIKAVTINAALTSAAKQNTVSTTVLNTGEGLQMFYIVAVIAVMGCVLLWFLRFDNNAASVEVVDTVSKLIDNLVETTKKLTESHFTNTTSLLTDNFLIQSNNSIVIQNNILNMLNESKATIPLDMSFVVDMSQALSSGGFL